MYSFYNNRVNAALIITECWTVSEGMLLKRRLKARSSQRKRKPRLNSRDRERTLIERRKAPRGTNRAAQKNDVRRRVADPAPGARRRTNKKRQTEKWKRGRGAVAARARRRKEKRIRNGAEQITNGASRAARTERTKTQRRTQKKTRARSGLSSPREKPGTRGTTQKKQRMERLGVKSRAAETESVMPRDGPGLGPDREDVAREKGHETGLRVSDEAAAETGSPVDQKAGIKETEEESTGEIERTERRRAT